MTHRRTLLATATAGLALAASQTTGAQEPPADPPPVAGNPCVTDATLLCPDLTMAPPTNLSVSATPNGKRLVLRAENRIVNVGDGPMEVRARRDGQYGTLSRAYQVIRREGGREPLLLAGAGNVTWKFVDRYRGSYWKYAAAARFELWRTDAQHRRTTLRRTGPKLAYCFRDLQRVRPKEGSPRRRFYGACSQTRTRQWVALGTSVGWADVYPATYPENWIDVTGLRGCYAFVHRADPNGDLAEQREDNNLGVRRISLPPRRGSVAPRGACR
ncbi:lysyl oxidase family protein [Conexibacter sp. SYSU D00693]|uniref:lysyl oxidase family protein n=1 Tax=Conexibacter sp. SYSU D00693 TaxID=2812560 RepID=UPI00196AEF98|nr:lysyl oxidase family protein [Conexibacter sp. SYSU D00693]